MSDKLSEAIITWVESSTGNAIEFASRELPLYIQELLHWTIVSGLFAFTASLAWTILFARFLIKSWLEVSRLDGRDERSAHWSSDGDGDPVLLFAITISGGLFTAIVPAFHIFNLDWLKAWLAPRVFLVEYAAELAS